MVNATSYSLESHDEEFEDQGEPVQTHQVDVDMQNTGPYSAQLQHNRLVASYLAQTRAYNPTPQGSTVWSSLQSQSTLFTYQQSLDRTAYTPPQLPLVPQAQHRVYVLRCAHCDSFVSDRGMRAVLLLRPHITLFSTDASPSNCGSLYSSTDEDPSQDAEQVERTCDCLTQSLGCFCCGNIIGYQIIVPCTRCTASVNRNSQRASNGHRYVFHHNEVTYSERKYHSGDDAVDKSCIECRGREDRTSGGRSPSPGSPECQPFFEGDGKEASSRCRQHWMACPSQRRSGKGLPSIGDTVYWHHLSPAGELSHSVDPRAQPTPGPTAGR